MSKLVGKLVHLHDLDLEDFRDGTHIRIFPLASSQRGVSSVFHHVTYVVIVHKYLCENRRISAAVASGQRNLVQVLVAPGGARRRHVLRGDRAPGRLSRIPAEPDDAYEPEGEE